MPRHGSHAWEADPGAPSLLFLAKVLGVLLPGAGAD
jgi:hypothetical protein